MAIFEDRNRATSFGADAGRYDRRRPAYPTELVDRLTGDSPGDAVDVGCGTGLLGTMLRARGWNVTGVESDERMAAVAERNGLAVEVSTFETWDARARRFDLVACAQAWHWIDPAIGLARAASVLRTGGRIALIWNSYRYDEPIARLLAGVVERHSSNLLLDSVFLGTTDSDHRQADIERFEAHASDFEPPTVETFEHHRDLTVDHWLDELPTHSQFATLPP
ncbi:class I SAM-dependent methyltransferase, partial [Ilumatobacter sp.]|uniref:class I SAM-dependent methyltransferase n=1 Tax=Ilumatobacter sp. TaxID=1967498 RepID=UPI003AF61057